MQFSVALKIMVQITPEEKNGKGKIDDSINGERKQQ